MGANSMANPINVQSHSGDPITLSEKTDLYGYYDTAKALAETLNTCQTPFVVGIYGRWGRGKSTFLKTVRRELKKQNKSYQHNDYSPWQYHLNSFNDVWLSMLSEIASSDQPVAKKLRKVVSKVNLRRFGRSLLKLGADFLPVGKELAGKTIDAALGTEEDSGQVANEYDEFIYAKKEFEDAISDYRKKTPNGRVFIYIDDVDRCEPAISVNVLRAIQVLARTDGCVFLLGLDRDVIVNNLYQVYDEMSFANEYLDKIVQLHIEIPHISEKMLKVAILGESGQETRAELDRFVPWIAELTDHNPRKIERFLYLFDFKAKLYFGDKKKRSFEEVRQIVLFTTWELRWPELASAIASRRSEVLEAIEELRKSENDESMQGVAKKYAYLPIIERIRCDPKFLHAYKRLSAVTDE